MKAKNTKYTLKYREDQVMPSNLLKKNNSKTRTFHSYRTHPNFISRLTENRTAEETQFDDIIANTLSPTLEQKQNYKISCSTEMIVAMYNRLMTKWFFSYAPQENITLNKVDGEITIKARTSSARTLKTRANQYISWKNNSVSSTPEKTDQFETEESSTRSDSTLNKSLSVTSQNTLQPSSVVEASLENFSNVLASECEQINTKDEANFFSSFAQIQNLLGKASLKCNQVVEESKNKKRKIEALEGENKKLKIELESCKEKLFSQELLFKPNTQQENEQDSNSIISEPKGSLGYILN